MPEPEPQPPHPRPISAWRWLLMLLPSVPMLVSPLIADAWSRRIQEPPREAAGAALVMLLFTGTISATLSFCLGFALEKWRGGNLWDWLRPLCYGVLILIVNAFISFAGCAVTERLSEL